MTRFVNTTTARTLRLYENISDKIEALNKKIGK